MESENIDLPYNNTHRAITLNLDTGEMATAGMHYYSNQLIKKGDKTPKIMQMIRITNTKQKTTGIIIKGTYNEKNVALIKEAALALHSHNEDKDTILKYHYKGERDRVYMQHEESISEILDLDS